MVSAGFSLPRPLEVVGFKVGDLGWRHGGNLFPAAARRQPNDKQSGSGAGKLASGVAAHFDAGDGNVGRLYHWVVAVVVIVELLSNHAGRAVVGWLTSGAGTDERMIALGVANDAGDRGVGLHGRLVGVG